MLIYLPTKNSYNKQQHERCPGLKKKALAQRVLLSFFLFFHSLYFSTSFILLSGDFLDKLWSTFGEVCVGVWISCGEIVVLFGGTMVHFEPS